MARGTQLSVVVENKPGQLAKVCAALTRAKVNIDAVTVVDTAEAGIIRLVTSSNAKAKVALQKAGMNVMQQSVLVVKMANTPGALATAARKLAAKGINIEYVYGSGAPKGQLSTIVLGVSDIIKAAKISL